LSELEVGNLAYLFDTAFNAQPDVLNRLACTVGSIRGISSFELMSDADRAVFSRTGSKIANTYNCSEVTTELAYAGPGCSAMHIHEDVVSIEVERSTRFRLRDVEDPVGRLLVSDLVNTAMCVLRLDIGDVGMIDTSKTACPCGRAGRSLRVFGRVGEGVDDSFHDQLEDFAGAPVLVEIVGDQKLCVYTARPVPNGPKAFGGWTVEWGEAQHDLVFAVGCRIAIDRRPRFSV